MMHALNKLPLVALLLSAFALLCAFSMQDKSLTYDEPQHYRYGAQILLNGDSNRFDDSKMPMSVINAIPRAIAVWTQQLSGADQPNSFLFDARTGRYATILMAVLLGYFVYRWSRELFGHHAGLLSLALLVLSPNIIAHARLVTTDIFVATWTTISLYCYWKFLETGTRRAGLLSALTLALAMIAKYSSVFLLPIFGLLLLAYHARDISSWIRQKQWQQLSLGGLKVLRWTAIYLAMIVLVLNVTFLFNRSFMPLDQYQFESSFFQGLQSSLGPLAKLPVPVPYPYLQGMDQVSFIDANLKNPIYLLGETRMASDPFESYYLVAWLFKEPIAAQILTVVSLLLVFFGSERWAQRRELLFLLIPIAFLCFYYSFLFHTQIGIRYILAIFPLFYIICGCLLHQSLKTWQRGGLVVLLGWQSISVLSWFPHYLPYFNEFIGDRTRSFKILADSNISWGQDEFLLEQYRREHPEILIQPWQPTAGRMLVDVNFIDRVFYTPDMRWLSENFEPVDHVLYSHLVYEVSDADYQRILEQRPDYFPDAERLNTRDSYYGLNYWTARNLMRLGQYQQALIHYQKLRAYLSNDTMSLEGLIEVSKGLGDTAAQQAYELELQELGQVESQYQESLKALEQGQYALAQSLLSPIVEARPDYKMALFSLGQTMQRQGNITEAIDYFRRYRELYPVDYQNLSSLAAALAEAGECDEATVLILRLEKLKPPTEEVQAPVVDCSQADAAPQVGLESELPNTQSVQPDPE